MSKLFFRNALAVLVFTFPVAAATTVTGTQTLNSGQTLSLDTNTLGTSSSGDLAWNGTALTLQGSATAADLANTVLSSQFTGQSGYSTLVSEGSTLISTYAGLLSSYLTATAIAPNVNDILIVKTNGGNYSAVLVTAVSSSITLEFTTFVTSTSTPSGPTITGVVNNYSYIPPGFPNSGIAPGSIFLIFGKDMSSSPPNVVLQSSASPGIPKTLEGATLSVSVGGTKVTPAMYYATPGQIAAVLPSNTPTGTATITVTYNNATSNAFQFQVVPYALGINTYNGSGSGLILATDTSGNIFTYTNSAKPGQTIVLYGSGLGADTADSDTVFTTTPHPVNTPLKFYIGGVPATVLYGGSSGYPGYDQFDITIPENVALSCYVGVVGVTGSGSSLTVSNFGSLAISASGGQCDDSIFGVSGSTVSTLGGQATVSDGDLFVGQLVSPTSSTNNTPRTDNIALATFTKISGASFTSSSGSAFSIGSCFVSEVVNISGGIPSIVGLDAGNISVAGPAGSYPLTSVIKGEYEASLPANAITSSGGAFTFTGSGGADVGSFKTTINLPNPLLDWTNQSVGASVNRAQGVKVTWTGGSPGSYVIIEGNSSDEKTGASGNFTCVANQSDLAFTVPAYVTSTLPAGSGQLGLENASSYTTFSAKGLDFGIAFGISGVTINSVYQ
jgi:uncharacterized protein (TIGR03437 family)